MDERELRRQRERQWLRLLNHLAEAHTEAELGRNRWDWSLARARREHRRLHPRGRGPHRHEGI